MDAPQRTPIRSRLHIPALLVVGAMAFGACGGSGNDSASSGSGDPTTTAAKKSATPSDNDSKDASKKVVSGKPVTMVPIGGTAPDGYTMVTAECELSAEDLAAEKETSGFNTYHSDITFASPADWQTAGRGSGGSGSTTGTDVTMTLMTPSNKKVEVDYKWDTRGAKGELVDYRGDAWKSFDYDVKSGDGTKTVTYEMVATVSIEDQDVELFRRNSAEVPGNDLGEQYKARVEMFTLPRLEERGGKPDMFSIVVTVDFDSDTTEATQDVIENIVSTMSIPKCVWDKLLISEETTRNMDLNGDGKIKTPQEVQEELQAMLKESKAKAEADAKNK